MHNRRTWTEFKSLIDSGKIQWQYEEFSELYDIYGLQGLFQYETRIFKDGGADQIDFEGNYKAVVANKMTLDIKLTTKPPAALSTIFTSPDESSVVDISESPAISFSVQVIGTGAVATSWDVELHGSLDGLKFESVLHHRTEDGDGAIVTTNGVHKPMSFFKVVVNQLTLGSATNIKVVVVGVT